MVFLLIFQRLGLRGVLDLLGIRCTVGSHDILPPPKVTLLESFTQPHHPSAKLSVGGRALSKHSHRDDSLQWWGICTGSEYGQQSVDCSLQANNSMDVPLVQAGSSVASSPPLPWALQGAAVGTRIGLLGTDHDNQLVMWQHSSS